MHAQFLRIKKLTGKAIIEVAARHNCREILAELGAVHGGRINPARVGLNQVLRGHSTAAAMASHAQTLMDAAGVKSMRKDAVKALEIIFSLPPESSIDQGQFFYDAVQWAEHYFAAPIISAIVHNDEAAPHCHVLILPLVDGRMIGSDLMGGRAKLQALQTDFYAQVGQRHGLVKQAAQKRPSAATGRQAIELALEVLEANSGLNSDLLRVLLEPHAKNPEPLMLALGLSMPTAKAIKGEFAKMMTKPCKPEKPIGFANMKPIGFDAAITPEKGQTLCSVGFDKSKPSFSPTIEPQSSASKQAATIKPSTPATTPPAPLQADADTEGDYTRERDDGQQAEYWDEQRGEFARVTVKASCKPAVIASVRVALEAMGRYGGASVAC